MLLPAADLHAARSHQRARHGHAAFYPLPHHDSGATTKLIGGAAVPARRSDRLDAGAVPAVLAVPRRPTGATATALLPVLLAPRRPARHHHLRRSFPPLADYVRSFNGGASGGDSGWGAGPVPPGLLRPARRRQPRRRVPALLALRHGDQHHRAAAALLSRRRQSRPRRGIFPLLAFFGHDRGQSLPGAVPAVLAVRRRPRGPVDHGDAAGSSTAERHGWSGRAAAALLVGRRRRAVALRAVPAVLALPRRQPARRARPWPRSTCTAAAAARPPTRCSRCSTTGAARDPGGGDETSFTLFPFVHYRRDAYLPCWRPRWALRGTRAPRRRARGRLRRAVPLVPRRRSSARAASRCSTSTRPTARPASARASADPGSPSTARATAPACCSRCSAATTTRTSTTPTCSRPTSASARPTATRSTRFLPLYWHSRWARARPPSSVPGTGTAAPTVSTTPVWCRSTSTPRTTSAPCWSSRRCCCTGAPTSRPGHRAHQRAALLVYHTSDRRFAHDLVLFPLWWSGHEQARSHRVLFPFYWHFARPGRASSSLDFVDAALLVDAAARRAPGGLLPDRLATRTTAPPARAATALLPLFYEAHGPHRFRLFTALAGYSKTADARTWYVRCRSRPATASTAASACSCRSGSATTTRATETNTRIFPPLLFVSRTTPETSADHRSWRCSGTTATSRRR